MYVHRYKDKQNIMSIEKQDLFVLIKKRTLYEYSVYERGF